MELKAKVFRTHLLNRKKAGEWKNIITRSNTIEKILREKC